MHRNFFISYDLKSYFIKISNWGEQVNLDIKISIYYKFYF